jgi:hypothetical protein
VAARDLEGIAAGSEWSVPIRLRGMSELLVARPELDSVRVLRAPETPAVAPAQGDSARETAPRGTTEPSAAPKDTAAPGRAPTPPRGRGAPR